MAKNPEAPGSRFRELLRVLIRRRFTIALVTALVVVPTLNVLLLRSSVYAATARVVLQGPTAASLVNPAAAPPVDRARTLKTQLQLFTGEPLRAVVQEKLGSVPKVSAKGVGDTDVIAITARDGSARKAAATADAYANAFVDLRRKQTVDNLAAAGQEVQTKVNDAQKRVDDLDAQLADGPADRQATVRQALSAERTALAAQLGFLRTKLDQLQIDQALTSGGAEILSYAPVPGSPSSPRPVRTGLIALAVGLVLGTAAAFIREYLDDSVKTREEMSRLTGGRPVLGVIPVSGEPSEGRRAVVSLTEPQSAAAEAYRSLSTSIQFLALDAPVVTIEVTSPGPKEGKTTTVANLGVAMARVGQRVVVVCCDLRRPSVHEFYGVDGRQGLTSVILGKAPLSAVLQHVPGQSRLAVLPSGPLPPNPSEILSSWRFAEVMTSLQEHADVVLVDAPPVLPVTDAMVLSGRVDATLLVAVAGVTTRQEVTRAVELLSQVGAPIVGTVLNGVDPPAEYGYGSYYQAARRPGTTPAPR
ncbi:MAG: polysaccharide biosynthesis tyrosine autokinase [Acidimicrobiales bacterium]